MTIRTPVHATFNPIPRDLRHALGEHSDPVRTHWNILMAFSAVVVAASATSMRWSDFHPISGFAVSLVVMVAPPATVLASTYMLVSLVRSRGIDAPDVITAVIAGITEAWALIGCYVALLSALRPAVDNRLYAVTLAACVTSVIAAFSAGTVAGAMRERRQRQTPVEHLPAEAPPLTVPEQVEIPA